MNTVSMVLAAAEPGSRAIGFAAVFGAMFAIANPISGIPFFLGYSSPLVRPLEKFIGALVSTVAVLAGCFVVLYAGDPVLNFFGISVPGLKVGGGFVILLSGIAMMRMHIDDTTKSGRSLWQVIRDLIRRGHSQEHAAANVIASSPQAAASLETNAAEAKSEKTGHSFIEHLRGEVTTSGPTTEEERKNKTAALLTLMFPFSIPMILGPGFISTILITAADNPKTTVIAAFSLLAGIQLVAFALAVPINRIIGTFGMNTLIRLVGLVIIILAFEIMIEGGLTKLLPGLA